MRPKPSASSRSAAELPSTKFAQIYESLPPEFQLALAEKHLLPLLDSIDKRQSDDVVSAAITSRTRFKSIPTLDLKGKKKEVNLLLACLQKDSKISIAERSNRRELLEELFDSLTNWLSDIWSVVYEHNFGYLHANTCLLFVLDVISKLEGLPGECQCSIMNMPVNVTIKNKGGRIVKDFSVSGPHGVERILLWIWRDLFLSLLARGLSSDKKKTAEMLESVEFMLDWTALERLLYGGKQSLFGANDRGDDDEFDDDDGIDEDSEEDEDERDEDERDEDESEDEDECGGDEDEEDNGPDTEIEEDESMSHSCRLHASHWTTLINNQRFRLRQIVEARLRSIFEVTPSLPLFMTILSISGNVPEAQQWLFSTISQNAPHTSETLVAALEIFAAETEVPRVLALLDSYSYLLRPRDAHSLQLATITISESPKYHARAIPIIIKELADSIREIHVAVRSVYSHIDEAKHQRELVEILKLRAGRVRRERMEAWVEAVSSPPGPMHPMAPAAAMMMGLPIPPLGAQGEDPDVVAMLDLSPAHDRDLEDLREEFRPRLGERFDGWRKVANDTKGGSKLLADAHARAVKLMPFLRATDAVRALLTEFEDRSNKNHIYAALETLSSFCRTQQKIIIRRTKNKKARTVPVSPASPGQNDTAGVLEHQLSIGINDVD